MDDSICPVKLAGNVKIETFNDHTGKKVAETEGHNLFTDFGMWKFQILSKLIIGGQFGGNIFFNEDGYSDGPTSSDYGFLKYLMLTDNSNAISASDCAIPGNMTGVASRYYSTNSDSKHGLLNLKETLFTSDGLKAVFDFATDRAVGTHKSVFWSCFESPNSYTYDWEYAPLKKIKFNRSYGHMCEGADGFFYGTVNNSLYKIDPSTNDEVAVYTLGHTGIYSIDVANGKCYYSCCSKTIYVFDLSSQTETSLSVSIDCYYLCVIGNYIYFNSVNYIYRYDITSGTSQSHYVGVSSTIYPFRVGSQLYYSNPNSGAYSLNSYNFDTNTSIVIGDTAYSNVFLNVSTIAYPVVISVERSMYNGNTSNSNCMLLRYDATHRKANMITGKVLEAPVVKTNDQTMKVTYTISFS